MHRLSSDQVGHFLTATHLGFVLTERDNYIARQRRAAADYRAQHPYLVDPRHDRPTTDMQVQFAFEKEQYLRAMVGHELIADRTASGWGITSTLGAPLVADVPERARGRQARARAVRAVRDHSPPCPGVRDDSRPCPGERLHHRDDQRRWVVLRVEHERDRYARGLMPPTKDR
jgi:hypothetical protein